MSILKQITHRPLWFNILVGLLLVFIIFFVFLSSLNWITHHGRASTVPSVTGKSFDEAKKQLKKAGFEVEIQDSLYVDTVKPLTVIKQIPEADEIVKANRTVYLLISRAVAPLVDMPNLVGYSYRNAEMVLSNMDLKIGDTTFKPDFAKNAVLEQWYNGMQISPATKLRKGSVISLVLGDGIGKREFAVPDIIGMSFCQAREMLEQSGIIMGAIVTNTDVSDTCNSYIYWQNPARFDDEHQIQHIRSGQTMDVKLQLSKPARDSTRREEDKTNENNNDRGYN
jgi:beta-lactam-binding protein with PASTA domain